MSWSSAVLSWSSWPWRSSKITIAGPWLRVATICALPLLSDSVIAGEYCQEAWMTAGYYQRDEGTRSKPNGISELRRRCARSFPTCSDGRCARQTIRFQMVSYRQDTAWSWPQCAARNPALCRGGPCGFSIQLRRPGALCSYRKRRRLQRTPSRSFDCEPALENYQSVGLNDLVAVVCTISNTR